MQKVFCDTNVILRTDKFNFSDYDKVVLSIVTIEELDHLKKDDKVGYLARQAIKNIMNATNVEINNEPILTHFSITQHLRNTNDNDILQHAYQTWEKDNDFVFLTDDYNLLIKARAISVPCELFEFKQNEDEKYTGYKIVKMSELELANWYEQEIKSNFWDLNINEYLLIESNNQIVEKFRWADKGFKNLKKNNYETVMFGSLRPKDIFQELAIDSLNNNQFTAITGKPGSGKSLISLMYIMWALEKQKYNSCILMFNPVKVRGTQDMGYYGGNVVEKGMQQFIGNMLISKFGDKSIVDTLINQGKLKLVPMADSRGMEISDSQILYITEAQNTTSDLLKIALTRCSKDAKVIIEGDPYQQVDKEIYIGNKNGLLRALEIFKGEEMFGSIYLPNIWRSKIADIADKM